MAGSLILTTDDTYWTPLELPVDAPTLGLAGQSVTARFNVGLTAGAGTIAGQSLTTDLEVGWEWSTIPNQAPTLSVSYGLALATYAPLGTEAYSVDGTGDALPDGLSLNASTGVVTGTPTTAQVRNVRFVATKSDTPTLAADWAARSTAAGVVWAQLFESAAPVNAYRFSSGIGHDPNPAGGSTGSYVRWLAGGGIMGNGCLELEQQTNGNMNSYWCRPFNPALSQYQMTGAGGDYGPGQAFYLQLRVKSNCGGASSTGGGGRKVFSVSRTENSYTLQEIVAQDTYYRGIYQMYQGVHQTNGAYGAIYTSVGGDFDLQPGSEFPTPPAYCSYNNTTYPQSIHCLDWGDDEWVTYLWHILPSSHMTANGNITAWYWKPGMVGYKKVIDYPNAWMQYTNGLNFAFNAALLWIYETGRTSGPANQKQWYDQVIFSTQPIAAPQI